MANQITSLYGVGRSPVVLPTLARTATPDTFEYELDSSRASGLIVVVDVTAIVTAPSITVKIDGVDRASGKLFNLLTSAAITTVSTVVLRVHPQLTAAANLIAKDQLPPVWRITSTHGNANSITYSVGAHLTY